MQAIDQAFFELVGLTEVIGQGFGQGFQVGGGALFQGFAGAAVQAAASEHAQVVVDDVVNFSVAEVEGVVAGGPFCRRPHYGDFLDQLSLQGEVEMF